jgi:hypothetical protein
MRLAWTVIVGVLVSRADASPPDTRDPPAKRTKIVAAASVGAVHLAYATWSYFAWYRDADTNEFFLAHEPLFGPNSYAGGADKLGHVWSNYALTRGTTAVLTAAGWPRLQSSLSSALLTEIAFTLTEVQDGFYMYGFEVDDMAANILGAGLAVLMDNVPIVDKLFDYRVEYFPSRDYRRRLRETGSIDVGQDYTGQSYLLALHLGAVPGMDRSEWTYWSRFIDLAVGFEAKHYEPIPEVRDALPRQTLYAGIAFNVQGLVDAIVPASASRRVMRGAFEVYSVPYTTLRFMEGTRTWKSQP